MRTNKTLASIILALSFPTLYCMWVKNIKNTWIDNEILKKHPDILFPQSNRFNRIDPSKEFSDALIFKEKPLPEIKQMM